MLIAWILCFGVGVCGIPTIFVPFVAIPLGSLALLAWIVLTILSLFGYNPQMKYDWQGDSPRGAWIGPCPKCEDQVALVLQKEAVTTNNFRCHKCNILIMFWEGEFFIKEPN